MRGPQCTKTLCRPCAHFPPYKNFIFNFSKILSDSLPSPSAVRRTCREGSCTQTATSQLSWPLLSAWCEAHEPTSQRAYSQPECSILNK